MSSPTRRVRCYKCSRVQDLKNGVCENCGEDLLLYGEVLRETEGSTTTQRSPSGVKRSGGGAGKLLSSRIAAKAAAAVLAVLTLVDETPPPPTGKEPAAEPAPSTGKEPAAEPAPSTGSTTPAPSAAASPGKTITVAGTADLNRYNQIPKNAVPDMYYWGNGKVTYKDEPNEDNNGVYNYKTDDSVVREYVAMLQKNGFTLVDSYDFSYKGSSFYSWGFVCDAIPNAEEKVLQYKDTKCHISLYYADKKGEYRMDVSEDLVVCDTGLRIDGSVADLRPQGTSVGAGLV